MSNKSPSLDPIQLEAGCCVLCGGEDRAEVDAVEWDYGRLPYVICRGCGLKYMHPRPSEAWYARFYRLKFWDETHRFKGTQTRSSELSPEAAREKRIGIARSKAERLARRIPRHLELTSDSLVLDVGTGFGEAPGMLKRRYGCRVLGVEPSESAAQRASEVNGVEIVAPTFEALRDGPEPRWRPNLISCLYSFNNLNDPIGALQLFRRLLAEDGVLYIDLNNQYYSNAINPYHPYLYTPETLHALLRQQGFEVERQYSEPHPAVARHPTDSYLAVACRKGSVHKLERHGCDVDELLEAQRLGQAKLRATRRSERKSGWRRAWHGLLRRAARDPRPSYGV